MLQEMFAKLQRKQYPEKTYDPLVMLPPELAEMIARHMDMRSRVLCLCVSKPWKKFLESCPDLWTTFDIRKAKRPITQRSIKAWLRRSKYSVNRAHINLYSSMAFNAAKFRYVIQTCKKLEYLELNKGGFIGETLTDALALTSSLKTLIVGKQCEVLLSHVRDICKVYPKLVVAEFYSVHSKGTFILHGVPWPRCASLETFRLETKREVCHFPQAVLVSPSIPLSILGW